MVENSCYHQQRYLSKEAKVQLNLYVLILFGFAKFVIGVCVLLNIYSAEHDISPVRQALEAKSPPLSCVI